VGIPDVNPAVNCNTCVFPLCPKCGGHRSVYYVRGHISEGTYILEDIDLSMTKIKNRPLDIFFTDCINPNSVTIRPSLKKIKYIPLTYHYLFELLERLRSSDCHKWPPIYGGLSCDFL
jgi:hypothetical protein